MKVVRTMILNFASGAGEGFAFHRPNVGETDCAFACVDVN